MYWKLKMGSELLNLQFTFYNFQWSRGTRAVSQITRALWAWVELNYRPHAYQACALTT